ncbi:MAG: ParB/RepB/Spo0J family partition protein [Candidatus Spechtbacteria bacterium]|nr:ParB/RepB/Spo0J family partition protein [Candidatus Spechtbacteria bacterium]
MRGLESLIPPRKQTEFQDGKSKQSVFLIETENISPNQYQPRKEFDLEELNSLADSIRKYGILQPLIVNKIEEDVPYGRKVRYELIAGERRLRAAKLAHLPQVPVVIRNATPNEKLEISLIENLQRYDLNPIEEALAYKRLQEEFGLSQFDIAAKVGKSRPRITNTLRILRLPQIIQDAVRDGTITANYTQPILSLKTSEEQIKFFNEICEKGMSANDAEDRAHEIINKPSAKAILRAYQDPELTELTERLKKLLFNAKKVVARADKNKAHLALEFTSRDEMVVWMKRWTKTR